MSDNSITPILFNDKVIYLHKSELFNWLIEERALAELFGVESQKLSQLRESSSLTLDRHFIEKSLKDQLSEESKKIYLWSRKGVIKVAYSINSEKAFDVVDRLEDIELKSEEPIFGELETILRDRLTQIEKSGNFKEIEEFISIFGKFIREKSNFSTKKEMGVKSIFMELFEDALKSVNLSPRQ